MSGKMERMSDGILRKDERGVSFRSVTFRLAECDFPPYLLKPDVYLSQKRLSFFFTECGVHYETAPCL